MTKIVVQCSKVFMGETLLATETKAKSRPTVLSFQFICPFIKSQRNVCHQWASCAAVTHTDTHLSAEPEDSLTTKNEI